MMQCSTNKNMKVCKYKWINKMTLTEKMLVNQQLKIWKKICNNKNLIKIKKYKTIKYLNWIKHID